MNRPAPKGGANWRIQLDLGYLPRAPERRVDPLLATLIDVAIAYRDNVGPRVAEAFLRETGVAPALACRVLEGQASQRARLPRRLRLDEGLGKAGAP
jgi:hypothetical protein